MRHGSHRTGTLAAAVSLLLVPLVVAALTLGSRERARAAERPAPGHCDAFGKSLAEWQALWVAWDLGDLDIAPDDNGNADIGHVALIPIPNTPGDGTPGSVDVTLHAGQPFVLPLWSGWGFSYTDGTPDDPLVPLAVFRTLKFKLTIDGVTVIDHRNLMDYYSQTLLPDPGLPIEGYPGVAGIASIQCIGIVHGPLPPGKHTITLDAVNTQVLPPQYGGGFVEYHNTWDITVERGK